MYRKTFVLGFLCLAVCVSALAAQEPLVGTLEAFRVVVGEDGNEVFVAADKARPADLVEYRLNYKNRGEAPLRNISITDPIPAGATYVLDTANLPDGSVVQFSIDNGRTYHAWPIMIEKVDENGNTVRVEATPDMVTHINWKISQDFSPGEEMQFSYRAVVK